MDQATPVPNTGLPAEEDVPKSAFALLLGLARRHWIFSGFTTILSLYFSALAIANACRQTSFALWLKGSSGSWIFKSGKWIHELFEQHHGLHEIILGLGGIAIGIFVAILIEESKEEKDIRLRKETAQITETTQKLVGLQSDLSKRVRPKVETIENYEKLLEEIGHIIDHAGETDGDLFIMNLTASFGYFMTFDCDTVLDLKHERLDERHHHERIQAISAKTGNKFRALHSKLLAEQQRNELKLKACVAKKDNHGTGKVHYLTLSPEFTNNNCPFIKKYLDPSLQNTQVEMYNSHSDENIKVSNYTSNIATFPNKLFLLPLDLPITLPAHSTLDTPEERLAAFKVHLADEQRDKIAEHARNGVQMMPLQEIPFQIYLSIPENTKKVGKGVFMFVNQYTLSTTTYLAAFKTEERELLETFRAIFNSVKNQTSDT